MYIDESDKFHTKHKKSCPQRISCTATESGVTLCGGAVQQNRAGWSNLYSEISADTRWIKVQTIVKDVMSLSNFAGFATLFT